MSDHPEHPQHSGHPEYPGHPGYSEKDVQREVTELEHQSTTAARIFDLRRIIGVLFVVYGVIVTVAGLTASDAEIAKAEGVNINLWTGIGMLLLGLFFLAWLKLRPTPPPLPAAEPEDRPTE
ncbi:hypothetical protein ACIPSA_17235 [Streptomyces sp. NPDC086549]|uniref:hypothetical protein n=1 Tax=Streptomyces sp. NPDC086549 TaxID=3365752 RepID=UPI0037FAB2A1